VHWDEIDSNGKKQEFLMVDRYLTGRTAMVTGGASGQGRAIALALAARGADLAIGSYLASHGPVPEGQDSYFPAEQELKTACQDIERHGVRAIGLDLDVRSNESCDAFLRATEKAFGKIDILINSAGIGAEQPMVGHPDETWLNIIDTNLTGYYRTIKRCLPGMIERRWGRIVNIATTAANVGAKDNAAYCASKAGILGLTRCVALEGAPHGVTCNAINPGFVNTRMLRSTLRTMKARDGDTRSEEQMIADIAASYPQKRIIEPEEIGNLAAFLCHDDAFGIAAEDITIAAGSLW
jgi:NAD(P)-dependent dehydrogenase (short-subunit alcohol dehydrogenase family)